MKTIERILLINANSTESPYRVAPIGLAFVASSLEAEGKVVRFLDRIWKADWAKRLKRICEEFNPQVVALAVRNLDNSDRWGWQEYLRLPREIVSTLHQLYPNMPVLIGGSAGTVDPERVLKITGADSLIVGEGELSLSTWLKLEEEGQAPRGVFTDKGDPFRVPSLQAIPAPKLYSRVKINDYLGGEGGYPIQTKRGCPLRCVYCTYAELEGRKYRFMPAKNVADEVEGAYASGVRDFEFVDSTFNLPERHALEVLTELKRRKLKANYIGTGLNPLMIREGLADSMAELGFSTAVLTAESASSSVLREYGKGYTVEKLNEAGRVLSSRGIHLMWVFLLGGPGETKDSVEETLSFISRTLKKGDAAYITCGIRVYPGAPLAARADDGGFSKIKGDLLGDVPFYLSPQTPEVWLKERLCRFQENSPHVMLSFQGHDGLTQWGLRTLKFLRVPRPYWRYLPLVNRLRRATKLFSF